MFNEMEPTYDRFRLESYLQQKNLNDLLAKGQIKIKTKI